MTISTSSVESDSPMFTFCAEIDSRIKEGSNDRTIYRRRSDEKWVDRRNDAERGFTFDTQAEAIASGREKLINAGGGELTVKGRDGKIRSKDTLGGGNDPLPPRDTEH